MGGMQRQLAEMQNNPDMQQGKGCPSLLLQDTTVLLHFMLATCQAAKKTLNCHKKRRKNF